MKINNENGVKGIFLVIFCISIFLFTRSNGYNILPFSNNIMLYLYSVIGSIVILYLSTSRIKLKAIDILCLVYFIYNLLWLLVTSKTKNIETIYLFFFLAMLYINIRNISSIYYKYILYSFPFIVISHFIYYICWENPYYFLYEHKGVFTGFLHNSGLWGEFVAMTLIGNIGLIHLNKKSKKTSTLLTFVSFIVSFMLYESDSRASWLSFSIGILTFFSPLIIKHLPKSIIIRTGSLLILICLCTYLISGLYSYKKDSADGRILIWKISLEMVKDKPILGYGFDGFRKNYMNYQAAYLQEKQLPETINNLADDNHHAFNEFLRIIIEQGIIGVIILFIFLTTIGYTIYKYKLYIDTVSRTIISCLTALLFFSFFSYPLSTFHINALIVILLAGLACSSQDTPIWKLQIRSISLIIPYSIIFFISSVYLFSYSKANSDWLNTLKGVYTNDNILEEARKKLSGNPYFLSTYGKYLNKKKRYSKAASILSQSIKEYPSYYTVMELGISYKAQKKYTEAMHCFVKAMHMIPHKIKPLYFMMELYYDQKDYKSAIQLSNRILCKQPKIRSSELNIILKRTILLQEKMNARYTNIN
ncbi:O-antigen ligase family protein [Bacteroides salyersiae]|uniref:O-antigen ligase family protein n=1 Tax=Bacteroides salyersiae TaxID=291644 RepID=UPI00189B3AC7|nr:O-antigen ligase family protein [Bacteroides salyersiae]